MDITVIKEV